MLKYITLGINNKQYFNYDGNPLPIRPLSTYELDECLKNAVEGIPSSIFDKVVKLKLDIIKDIDVNLNQRNYKEFLTYYNEIDYWTVYYSIKDFQDEEFSMPDYEQEKEHPKGYYTVKKMDYVHEIAKEIMGMTNKPVVQLMEILSNSKGKELATMVHRFHVPLVDEAWKLTPLQSDFLWYSRPDAPEIVKEIPGISGGNIKDISEKLRAMGLG